MALIKHRKFTADRYLDKFKGHEDVLWTYIQKWRDELPNFPAELTLESFQAYLKIAPEDCLPFEKMIEGLYKAHDLATPLGEELLHDAMDLNQVTMDPDHQLHREILALKLLTEEPDVFALAERMHAVAQGQRFSTFKGKSAKEILTLDGEIIAAFETRLRDLFAVHKGERKLRVNHFRDGDAVNFIIYHEERRRAELTFEDGSTKIAARILRPARQDVLSYLPKIGKIEIETPGQKDRDAMRRAFGEVCLGDADFFEHADSDKLIDYAALQKSDFAFDLDPGHVASLTELYFFMPQLQNPRFRIASKNVFETLEQNNLRPYLATAPIKAANIKITFPGKRGKTIYLSGTNKIAFNRSTHQEEVFLYLKRWGLLVE